MRVHELAKELGVTSKELLGTLEQMGVSGKSASSSVPEDLVPRLRASGGKATEAPKRREVLEPPPAPRKPKPKKAAAPKAEPKPADVAPAPVAEAPAPAAAPATATPAAAPAPAAPAAVPAPAADAAVAPPNGRQPRGPRKPVVPEP
ncbi:MAG TPA: translation initiation factor IF-2 N-terminal domain-containing protein, partial [Actinomycetota bacterium]|nr:translation initiation factor IF-2 N-terminal domain-containing protein [Actinomycetota bacterium]